MGGNKVSASGTAAAETVAAVAGEVPAAAGTVQGTAGVDAETTGTPGGATAPHQPATPPVRQRRRMVLTVLRSVTLWRLLLLVAVLAVWEWSSDRFIRKIFISRPSDVVVRLWELVSTG